MRSRHAADDQADFQFQFDGLYRRAYAVAFQVLLSREDAEDMAIETLARAFVRWRAIRGHAMAWVTRVSANQAIDAIRKQRITTELPEITASDPDVTESVDLRRAVRKLPRRQREAVVLRYLVGLSESDTADVMRCSAGAVKQHCHRGVAKLREAIELRYSLREGS